MDLPRDISLPRHALAALDALESAGFEAWCVGGCVRDAILKREVNDYDIATSATWQETELVMQDAGFAVHRTGCAHGTVTVSIDGNPIEITTYRTDGAYSDGRHPDSVEFVKSIEEDLARRDFTVNALAYHPDRGLLDCWGGVEDMEARVLRVVGEPAKRFSEDALRILRGCRFASQLGFSIAPDTLFAMKSMKRGLLRVSAERVTHELDALLLGDFVHDAIMDTVDVLGIVLPELAACKGFDQHTPYHIYDVLEHTAWVVQRSPATRLSRWAALLHDIGKPGAFFMDGERGHFYGHPSLSVVLARGVLQRLLVSPAFADRVLMLVRHHDYVIRDSAKSVQRALFKLGGDVELFRALVALKQADALAQSDLSKPRLELANNLESVLEEVLATEKAFTLSQLDLNGRDIIALGVDPGPEIGRILDAALDAVIDERVANDRDALLAFAAGIVQ